jgi:hypothetical protein
LSQDEVDLEATLDVSFGSNMIMTGQEIAATGEFQSIQFIHSGTRVLIEFP